MPPFQPSFDFGILQESNETDGAENAGGPNVLVGLNNSCLGKALAGVVEEMLKAADGVVDEGEAKSELDTALDSERETGDKAGDTQALEVQTNQRSSEVGERETVEGDGESRSGDSVPGGATEPCLLELVDTQMGRDRAIKALVNEDLLAFLLGDLCGCGSAMYILEDLKAQLQLFTHRTGEEVEMPAARAALEMF